MKIADVPGESPAAAYNRAYAAVGQAVAGAGHPDRAARLRAGAGSASDANARIERQLALRTLILAGPDAQVM